MALAEKSSPGTDTPLAHRRPGYPLAGCFPAEPASVSPNSDISSEFDDRNQPLDIGGIPPKIHRGFAPRFRLQDASATTQPQEPSVLGCGRSPPQERELSAAAARQAGVVFDAEVNLGGQKADGVLKQPYRVVIIARSSTRPGEEKRLVLVTNRMDLDADMIALAYRYRWQIELFFRWLKCGRGCKHLLSTSQNGVATQVYTELIASLLITLWVGRKPTKRTYEMLCLYFQGWASLDELMAHLKQAEGDGQTRSVAGCGAAARSAGESLPAAPMLTRCPCDSRRPRSSEPFPILPQTRKPSPPTLSKPRAEQN